MVDLPCPGYTIVSSGKTNNLFIIESIISSKLDVGKSVLPQAPENNVSPENKQHSFSQYKDELPFVCPGVCITLNSKSPKCSKSLSSILESAYNSISGISIYSDKFMVLSFNPILSNLCIKIFPPHLFFNSFTPPIWSL